MIMTLRFYPHQIYDFPRFQSSLLVSEVHKSREQLRFAASSLQVLVAMASSAQLGVHHSLVPHQSRAAMDRNSLFWCNGVRFFKELAPVTLKCRGVGGSNRGVGMGVLKAAVVTVENYVSGAPSLGDITKVDFPILDQVCALIFSFPV